MSYRRDELAVGEWFHCYTKTIDHSRPFANTVNSRRFMETLYLANQQAPMPIIPQLYKKYSHDEIFHHEREAPLVAIGAYALMPTHYHLLAMPLVEDGLSAFLHKVGTGFTRFYNDQHERVGNLFVKPFRSKHVSYDAYFAHVASYIHLNPAELFAPGFRRGKYLDMRKLKRQLLEYPFSSLIDYERPAKKRTQRSVLADEAIETIRAHRIPLNTAIYTALEYYESLEFEL